ncbi:MAG: polyphenol oxidase family protein, partial [Ignavibacteriaceae bacterium]|nr:polyphenol oxidase family protein [Ignavibacteriaceae bacterium]
MTIIKPIIFQQFDELIFGFNTKIGNDRTAPYFLNVSMSVGDDENRVKENRELFFNEIGLTTNSVVFQKQVHGDAVTFVEQPGFCGESDAMITDKTGLGIAISTGDCTAVFIYDKENKVIAGVHAGWRGTEKKILEKTLNKLMKKYKSSPANLFVYLAPSISQINYEVGEEVAALFDDKYLQPLN